MKTFLLDTKLANTYQVEGLDLSERIISFDDLGGIWKLTEDVTIAEQATVDRLERWVITRLWSVILFLKIQSWLLTLQINRVCR